MTVCPKYESAYREEELRTFGIGSLEVFDISILYLILNSRNTAKEISRETLPWTKGKYLRK